MDTVNNMYDVTTDNFNKLCPEIEKVLMESTFIAFDMEFSGIRSADMVCESLFDTPGNRYEKLRDHIKPYIVLQFGLTAFTKIETLQEMNMNMYRSKTYNFHLMPKSIPTKNRIFSVQASALEFLTSNNFDFNLNTRSGISYLNEEDEESLVQLINDKSFSTIMKRFWSYNEEDELRDIKHKVFKWMTSPEVSSELTITASSSALNYLIHKSIRREFPALWTINDNNSIHVIKTVADVRKNLELEEKELLEDEFLCFHIGFSKIFKLLVSLQKPMVGHNILLDLMFMYHQFYRSLPEKYQDFKQSIHQLFPHLYDTKYISIMFKNICSAQEQPKSTCLDRLCQYFESRAKKDIGINSPYLIKGCDPSDIKAKAALHNAGYDSYFAGYVFLKLSHMFALKAYGSGVKFKQLTQTELTSCLRQCVNRVHFNRGNRRFLRLDGPDLKISEPTLLCVRILKPDEISEFQIAEQFSAYGAVDVRRISRKHVMVAVGVPKTATDILQKFRTSKELRVYRPGTYASILPKLAFWSSLFLSSGIVCWILGRQWTSHFFKRL